MSKVARAFSLDTVMLKLFAAVKRGIKSQIISVIEHISKVRFGWLEDTTSILS